MFHFFKKQTSRQDQLISAIRNYLREWDHPIRDPVMVKVCRDKLRVLIGAARPDDYF